METVLLACCFSTEQCLTSHGLGAVHKDVPRRPTEVSPPPQAEVEDLALLIGGQLQKGGEKRARAFTGSGR